MNKWMKFFVFALVLLGLLWQPVSVWADKDKEEIVIVVDPGHGGSQNGAEYNGLLEKDINMVVSDALVAELEKYDGVKVYLTHESEEDTMSIKERAEFADEVEADYFFCIHFNASGNHNFYGAEAWVTSYGRYYSEMYAFSEILLDEFSGIGVYDRGIKTKLETDGTDYYGVLRRCSEFDIPAVIIEHCHMDNAMDSEFLDEEADLIRFAQLDAAAIAKFLKLKSSESGIDYSDYEYVLPEEPVEKIQNDVTDPLCNVTVKDINVENEQVSFTIEASDEEQRILYYGYSFDGGNTFSELIPWERDSASLDVTLDFDMLIGKLFVVRVYNAFNLFGDSQVFDMTMELSGLRASVEAEKMKEAKAMETGGIVVKPQTGGEIFLVIAILAILAAVAIFIGLVVDLGRKNSHK